MRIDLPALPALVVGTVAHTRRVPVRHRFRYPVYQWLVDVDDLPAPRWPLAAVARFSAADHLDGGRLGGDIRGDLGRFLAGHGVPMGPQDRVLMLANAQVLGYVFDPLTVLWCLAPDGSLRALVLEVHNTYGERHAYLLDPGVTNAEIDKAFYVSPFNDTTGRYAVSVQLGPSRVTVTVALERDGERVLTAVVDGRPRPATPGAVARVALRHPFMPQVVSALIRLHGVRLWRRLPVQPRTPHPEEAVR